MEKLTDLQKKGNAAIAVWLRIPSTPGKFGGLYYDGHDLEKAGLPFSTGWMGTGTDTLKFHSSWDWLMVVVGAIREDDRLIMTEAYRSHGRYLEDTIMSMRISSERSDVWDSVVAYAEWCNSQNY